MKDLFTNKSLAFIDSKPNKKGAKFENKFTCILQETSTFCAFKNSEGIPIPSRRHTEPKTEHIFYPHNHFTTMTKLPSIAVVKNMIHDKLEWNLILDFFKWTHIIFYCLQLVVVSFFICFVVVCIA